MKSVAFVVLVLVSGVAGYAQELADKLTFYLLDTESGLSNNTINSIVQDSVGFIWVGTTEGLNRYDGRNFITHKKDLHDSLSLSYNFIQKMHTTAQEIWIPTDGGLYVYDINKESYRHFNEDNGMLGNSVNSVIEGPDGQMIMGVYRSGLHFLMPDGSFEYLKYDKNSTKGLSSNEISSLELEGDSILWVGTFDAGLNKIRLKDWSVEQILLKNNESALASAIYELQTDRSGNLWIGSGSGLFVITAAGDTLSLGTESKPEHGLSDDEVLCFEEDERGNMWIGTRNGGLNILNINSFLEQNSRLLCQWYLPQDDGQSVYNRTVSTILQDRSGNMWLGTSTGLNFVNPSGEKIIRITRNSAQENTLSHNRISALEHAEQGKIWVGTDGGGLDLYDPFSGDIQHFIHDDANPYSLSNDYILSLLRDSRGRLWAGTYQGGINRLDTASGHFSHYLQGDIQEGSDVRCITEDSDGNIWVGTNRGGLYLYLEESDSFTHIDTLAYIDIRDIIQAEDGGLWLATFGSGIYYYHPKKDSIRTYNSDNTPGLTSNVIFNLIQLQEDAIWAGTRYGGLVRLNINNGTAKAFTEKDGLSNNTINSIITKEDEAIWLGTARGITRFCLGSEEYEMVTLKNLQYDEFNVGSALLCDRSRLYFGSNKGLITFHADKVLQQDKTYPLVLTQLKLFNEKVAVEKGSESLLDQALFSKDTLVFNYDQTLFSIDFNALRYPTSDDVSYSYILENYDDQWIDGGNAGTANFSNVPPGEYIFKVKTNHGGGETPQQSKALSIIINPPFWQTWPAYFLYIFTIVAILYGAVRYYGDRIRLKNSLLFERRQRELEHDINEERLRFFTSFSHELKTPLTLILAPIEDMVNNKSLSAHSKALQMVHKNAQFLLQLINKLLELRKSETGLNQLDTSKNDICLLLKNWTESYQTLANHKKIKLSFHSSEERLFIFLDEEKMHIIINNLLSNALKFTPKGGEVKVSLSKESSQLIIKIQDTGIGISEAEQADIFNWYFSASHVKKLQGTGIGLALSKKLVELHHGSIMVSSQPNQGSTFTISLPTEGEEYSLPLDLQEADISLSDQSYLLPEGIEQMSTDVYEQSIIHTSEQRKCILLVDDNPDVIQYLKGLLAEEYHIISAPDGEAGLEKARKYIPDLIISDIMMPGKDGIDLCKALKASAESSHIPLILLSAKGGIESHKAGFEEGADAYITKPFNSQLLLIRISNLFKQREQLKQYFGSPQQKSQKEPDSPLFRREKKFLEDLEKAILTQLESDNANVEDISQQMGMSRTSLYRKLKSISGKNINEYIRMVKLNKAYKLIQDEGLSVSQAAFNVGFSNQKYFRKLFKEQFGKLPSQLSEFEGKG
ncbi:two-component regulator propeller domain-containing protein [Porifericola rhodea]|uniref:hybrid sensor histidine kinase/response regulator transcription factor n=1 Tax=Porifericola rhodea TaxID=930972 RepID=UPI0026662A15|nr:two-component regulator propeller domain-containing protein [Porifericola rhodea]WKN31512.1 two-component regulator propeller domain-containing protein [Porifericola rhodea]